MNKCLYCYKELNTPLDFHKACSKAFFGTINPPKIDYSFNEMIDLAKQIVNRSISVPGVQAKLSMSIFDDKTIHKRMTIVDALGGSYILKPPSLEYAEMPANEHLTMKIAQLFNINVVPHTLIRLASGELSYITKRIDRRNDGSKIHMLDMFQIVEAFDKYRGSMERIGKAIDKYSENTLFDKLRFFELTLFSFITGNNDMHLKNFSMIKESYGWTLSSAYDLLNVAIVNPNDTEELALTLAGKKKKFTQQHFIDFGLELGLNTRQINNTIKQFKKHIPKAKELIQSSFLSNEMKEKYTLLIDNRLTLFA